MAMISARRRRIVRWKWPRPDLTFRLRTLLLAITIIAAWLAVWRWAPPVAIVLAVLVIPAFVRTAWMARHAAAAGKPLTLDERIMTCYSSLIVVAATDMALLFAFFTAGLCGVAAGECVGNALGLREIYFFPVVLASGLAAGLLGVVAMVVLIAFYAWPTVENPPCD